MISTQREGPDPRQGHDAAPQVRAKLMEGVTLQQAGRLAEAERKYRDVLAAVPAQFDALHLLGVLAAQAGRFEEAVDLIGRAIAIDAKNAAAHYNLGYALEDLRRYDAAIASYDRAIALRPDYALATNNRGTALAALRRYQEAVTSFDRALRLNPAYAEAHYNRGVALDELLQHAAALECFDKALAINPDYEFLRGMRLYSKMRMCDWRDAELEIAALAESINAGAKASPPWPALGLTGSLPLQRRAAEIWMSDKHPQGEHPGIPARPRRGKIRVGYFSADFRDHPVSTLTAALYEQHDREKFEVMAFSFGPDSRDEMCKRLETAFDEFHTVGAKTDPEIAALARHMELDIAVDLTGLTTGARPGIFANRAAPLQVNYLGYPGTMGAAFIDYIIADETLIPAASRRHYAEKIAYLPCFQANDTRAKISETAPRRGPAELPESGFVFCCFNGAYKIAPPVFDRWMRILKAVDGSVLWLSEKNDTAVSNLRREAVLRGVKPDRLVFAKRVASRADHLARHGLADLFLDTLPYNAHTTASDALWAGVPVLTCAGESFAGRVAASLLLTIGLPELIAATPNDYEALAVALAQNPARLGGIREKLARNRLTTPLYDARRFARSIEAAYERMVERHEAGLPPEHIFIDA